MYIEDDKLAEECGVFGIYDMDGFDVARLTYYGLYALQHRGQQSCGIVTNDDGVIRVHKDNGLVNEVFDNKNLAKLKGTIAVGHVRYGTAEESKREDAQPLVSRYLKGSLTVANNGSLINARQLREKLEEDGAIFQSNNDTEVIMHLAARARTKTASIEDSIIEVMKNLEGAYSMVIMSPRKLIGARDPQGFRPLCIGKLKNSYVLASESAGLDVLRAEFVRDVEPGEVVVIDNTGLRSIRSMCGVKPSLCVFEYVYIARPDSVIDGLSVYNARVATGKILAKVKPVEADMVIGVPDSGLSFAVGYAEASGIPYGEGLVKNRYTGRTFIKPTQEEREMAVSIKLNALVENIKGKRVIIVDDSIVRGTTCTNMIKLLKNAGATEVHMRVASPPFLWPCYFGVDIGSRKDLMAVRHTEEEMCKIINADTLAFFPVEEYPNIGLRKDFGYCDACFNGNYPIRIPKFLEDSKDGESVVDEDKLSGWIKPKNSN